MTHPTPSKSLPVPRWLPRLCFLSGIALTSVVWSAPTVRKSSGAKLPEDPRLQTRLIVSAPGISLRELLPRVSRATGATLTVVPEVAEEKVVIFGPSRPAWETLEDLAALLDLRWERSGSVPPTFRLSRTPQATHRVLALQIATAQRVRALADEHAAALSETPEQLRQRPKRDLTRSVLEEPEFRTATVFYSLLSDRQKDELFQRKQLLFALEGLGPPLQAPLREIYTQRVQQEEKFYGSAEGQEVIRQAALQGGSVHRRLLSDLERNSFRIEALRADGKISVGINLGSAPTAASTNVDENGNESFATSGWPITLVDTARLWLLPSHGNPYQPSEIDSTTLESFDRVVAQQKPAGEWVDQLHALAETAGKPVLADYYRGALINRPPTGESAGEATTEEQRLDRFCTRSQYLWWTRGSSLLLRKRDWYDQGTYELSDTWLARVAERLASRNGTVTAGDLPLATPLTPAQVAGLAALAQGQGVYDSGDGEAFRMLLSLATGALRLLNPAIPETEGRAGVAPLTLTAADLTLVQRRTSAEFGRRMGWLLTPMEQQAFQLQISAGPRKSPANAPNVQYVPIRFRCEFGAAHRMTATLYLPLGIPHDRRAETVVERAP